MNTTEFLQSEAWAKLQEAAGHGVVRIGDDAYGFVHVLPFVGRYLYTPRWPMNGTIKKEYDGISEAIEAAKKSGAKWIRLEPEGEKALAEMRHAAESEGFRMIKAPHDMQPRETFVIDISKSEEALLAAMKPKTRYNIRLAKKKGVRVFATHEQHHREAFIGLIMATAERKDIVPHPRSYYEKFFTELSDETLSLFVAEYDGRIIAANLLIIFGEEAIYLHGGSGDLYRDTMAPFLLQWEQIKFAKMRGCTRYDFGGVKTSSGKQGSWSGITRFKMGFSPETEPATFPGCYDIVLDRKVYFFYDCLRFLKGLFVRVKRFF
jgi:peptidoglycan pentaglycine glycine transferase (the first glycine)